MTSSALDFFLFTEHIVVLSCFCQLETKLNLRNVNTVNFFFTFLFTPLERSISGRKYKKMEEIAESKQNDQLPTYQSFFTYFAHK